MKHLYWLDQIQPGDRPDVGDQAFHLSQLARAGYPVPTGFVIPTQVLSSLMQQIQQQSPLLASALELDLFEVDHPQQLQAIARQLRQAITSTVLEPAWLTALEQAAQQLDSRILLLSASLSLAQPQPPTQWQGLLERPLCWGRQEALVRGIQQVWSSLFQAKSLFFWRRSGIALHQLRLAVLVQPIGGAIAANGRDREPQEILASGCLKAQGQRLQVEAAPGLGLILLSGEVIPDQFELDRQTYAIRQQTLGHKTYSYRLAQPSDPTAECLWGYALEEAQPQFSLTEQQLQVLTHLTRNLTPAWGKNYLLEWTLEATTTGTQPPTFCWRQIEPLPLPQEMEVPPQPNPDSRERPISLLPLPLKLEGLAAAAGQAIAPALVLHDPQAHLHNPPAGVILVVSAFHPDGLPLLRQAAGIICETGGMTCHGAIMARELGLPAVVGVVGATRLIQTGEILLLHGDRGEVYQLGPNPDLTSLRDQGLLTPAEPAGEPPVPPSDSNWPLATQLLVNLSQRAGLERLQNLPIHGIGLLRSELMMLEALDHQHPQVWLQQGRQAQLVERLTTWVQQFALALAPRPVFYRSLDLRSHELRFLHQGEVFEPVEVNPMLGLRGVSRYLRHPELFQLELLALAGVYHQGQTNVHLILPFVRTVEEFRFCLAQIDRAGLRRYAAFQVWVMAEVPSILFLLPEYVRAGVQGISIGSNDLTQLLLGVDREDSGLANLFEERHPAVMAAIAQLIQMAKQLGIPCSICGQAPVRYPEIIDSLVAWGITSISVEPDAVLQTRTAIAQAEQRLYFKALRSP